MLKCDRRKIQKLVLATENRGKFREFFQLAQHSPLSIQALWEQDDWQNYKASTHSFENHTKKTSYRDNARAKARAIQKILHCDVLADDSGLEIEALGGEPGIRSANYISLAPDASYQDTVLPAILEKVKREKNKKARFVCSLILCTGEEEIEAKGVCEGEIGEKTVGLEGFAYDPIFLPKKAFGKSMAQLSLEEKNILSHRALAFKSLLNTLRAMKLV